MKTLLTLAAVAALAGCSATDLAHLTGSVSAHNNQMAELQRYGVPTTVNVPDFQAAANYGRTQNQNQYTPQSRPLVRPTASFQPQLTPGAEYKDGFHLIMVNTPKGIVQRRCRMLKGNVVGCI